MREIRTSGSVGTAGGQPSAVTRPPDANGDVPVHVGAPGVRVHVVVDAPAVEERGGILAAANPLFGMCSDRVDIANVEAFSRQLRAPRRLGEGLPVLIDTAVLIWLTRGHVGAAQRLSSALPWRISAVPYMELLQGCRDKQDMQRVKAGLGAAFTAVLPVTVAVSDRAVRLVETYSLSHGLQLADALIAATALEQDLAVLTANVKHFRAVAGLRLDAFVP